MNGWIAFLLSWEGAATFFALAILVIFLIRRMNAVQRKKEKKS